MMVSCLYVPPLILVCSDAALNDFFHFRNGYLIETARLYSLHTQNQERWR